MSSGGNDFGEGVAVGIGVCVGVVTIAWLYARINYPSVRRTLANHITGAIAQKATASDSPQEVRTIVNGMNLYTGGNLWRFVDQHITLTIVDGFDSAIGINPNSTAGAGQ